MVSGILCGSSTWPSWDLLLPHAGERHPAELRRPIPTHLGAFSRGQKSLCECCMHYSILVIPSIKYAAQASLPSLAFSLHPILYALCASYLSHIRILLSPIPCLSLPTLASPLTLTHALVAFVPLPDPSLSQPLLLSLSFCAPPHRACAMSRKWQGYPRECSRERAT